MSHPILYPDETAHPIRIEYAAGDEVHHGLTKREYFALHLMAGMLAATDDPDSKSFASGAVFAADKLIEALNKPPE